MRADAQHGALVRLKGGDVDAERFERVKQLIAALDDIPEPERDVWLDRACAGDHDLRMDVEALRRDDVPSILRTGGLAARVAPIMADHRGLLGSTIGPYRIVDVLGEGGMGVVYHAEQIAPIQRDVALKLVPPGMDTARFIARFEQERQAIALMNHPYIAQVFDAGAAPDGRPYFAMELVRGEPVTEYCAREQPPLTARLELFLQICDAIQHAHQRGIIHRDLKPSNVLLTRQGDAVVPKIIDFGIAKAVGDAAAARAMTTQAGQIVGTPEYMSPEQAGVIDAGLDTRTDVYSLGVMLYELVTGRRPYELKTRTPVELARVMRTPPTPPSQMPPAAGARRVALRAARDIDAVALMAMEQRPDDRYPSVEQLAADVRRVLEQRPVLARTHTLLYRAERFIRRHAAGVATAAVVAVLLVASGVVVVRQRNRAVQSETLARAEAARARAEAEKASAVAQFLTELFREADPARARGATVTARDLLNRGADRLSTGLAGQDVVRATLMDTIGNVYRMLGMIDESEKITNESLAIRRRALGAEHADVAQTLDNLGQLARERTRYDQAEQLHRDALAMRRKLLDPRDAAVAESLSNLALALRERGKYDEALPLVEEALAIRREKLGPEHASTLASMNVLGDVNSSMGRGAVAEQLYREVLAIRRRILPADHPSIALSLHNVGGLIARGSRRDEAEAMMREALAIRRKVLDPDHPDTTSTMLNLASLLHDTGRLDEAETMFRDALAADRRHSGSLHMDVAIDLNNLASLLEERGKLQEASAMFEESMHIRITLQGENHPSVPTILNNLGRLRYVQGRFDDAEKSLRRAIAIRESLNMATQPRQADSRLNLGRVLETRGRLADAEREYQTALGIYRAASPNGSASIATALLTIGHLMVVRKNAAGAEAMLRDALAQRLKFAPAGHASIGNTEAGLADCLMQQAKWAEAETLLVSALKTAAPEPTAALYSRRKVLELLVTLYTRSGRPDAATPYRAALRK